MCAQAPDMKDDLQRKFTLSSHTLVCFSIGYFLYDAVDMVLNHRKRSTYELLLHHGLVILCYSVAGISGQFAPSLALSLIVEVNSVFLHARQLFIITSEPKNSLRYKANALLNVVSFLFFRLILLAYMTRWLAFQRSTISFGFLAVGFVGLGVIVSRFTHYLKHSHKCDFCLGYYKHHPFLPDSLHRHGGFPVLKSTRHSIR